MIYLDTLAPIPGKTKEERDREFQEMLAQIDRDSAAARACRSSRPSTIPEQANKTSPPKRADEPLVFIAHDSDDSDAFELLPSFAKALPEK